jgi:chromosome segregation ATPase
MKPLTYVRLVLSMVGAMAVVAPMRAQNAGGDNATLQALLAEIHQLRLTMEKTALLGPRMQLVLQRAQMQEQRVARISQQLDDVRNQEAGEAKRHAQVSNQLAGVEQEMSAAGDGERRKQLEAEHTALKRLADAGPDPQLSARESDLSSSLQSEQATLNELNAKLDVIERQLEAPQPADTPPAGPPR